MKTHCSFVLKAQRKIITLHLALLTPSNILNLVKEWGKISSVWWKGVKCSVMNELKHYRILSFKFFIIASLPLEYKEVL
jgi:hypothetical protein